MSSKRSSIETTVRWSAIATVVGALWVAVPARAQNGDGICQANSQEAATKQCSVLGVHVLEIVPSGGAFPVNGTCQVNGSPKICAFWPYRFSGPSADNQLNILIPANVDIYPNQTYPVTNTLYGGCQQVYAAGQGDPTTGFGKGIITHKVCRVALNIDAGVGTPNFVLATALSGPTPLPVQLKSGRNIFFDDILGPGGAAIPRLASTTQEITSIGGAVLSVETDQTGALVSATSNTGPVTIIRPGFAVLCTPQNPTNAFPNNFPGQYDCAPIVENLDGTNLQAGEHSTCYYRRSDGSLLKYTCPIP
jgi:hypothetical protein